MQTQQYQDEVFIHIRLGECEFEVRGPAPFIERQVTQFYHNSVIVNGGRHIRQNKEENDK